VRKKKRFNTENTDSKAQRARRKERINAEGTERAQR
jgi:hypothetical protein